MSDRERQPGIGDASLDADVALWSADPALASLVASPEGVLLVFDRSGARLLGAVENGMSLRTALAKADGHVREVLRLPAQLRQLAESPNAVPRLLRLRLDRRAVARPTACLASRAVNGSGDHVILIAPMEPIPVRRSAPRGPERAPAPAVEAPPDVSPAPVSRSGRFVWRSDAAGLLAHVSDASCDGIAGRSWQALHEAGVVRGPGLLESLSGDRTFRALPVTIRPSSGGAAMDVVLSGAPIARSGQPFAGFTGFGIVRSTHATEGAAGSDVAEVELPSDPPVAADDAQADEASGAAIVPNDWTAQPTAAQEAATECEDEDETAAPHQTEAPARPVAAISTDSIPQLTVVAETAAEPSRPDGGEGVARSLDLSIHEHDAFREIARALGARFEGDEQEAAKPEAAEKPLSSGAVMAFPGGAPQTQVSAIDAAIVAALDRLPAGVLVHRDAAILYVNDRFLSLSGHEDREAFLAKGGFAQVLNRLPESQDGISESPVTVTAGNQEDVPLLVERSKVDWDGGPAELLLARAAEQADETRAQIAKSLSEGREPSRERLVQELLDQVTDGVAILDEAGRILTLNASAASLLQTDRDGGVGTPLMQFFAPEGGLALTEALRRARECGAAAVDPAALRKAEVAGALLLRIHRLSSAQPTRFCATLRRPATVAQSEAPFGAHDALGRPEVLDRVSEEIRAPIKRILDRSEILLSEQNGVLATPRGGEYLREIHHAGEQILGMTDDLRDLSRIGAGRADLSFKEVVLNDIVTDCLAKVQREARHGRIVVRTSLSQDLAVVLADERSMRQATLNVIVNAIRLTEAGGQVIVSTTVEHGGIAFRVRDTGLGMTPDEIERALSASGRRQLGQGAGGSGLALMLTKALVEANRGHFRITSRKDEGTLVEMLFPSRRALSA